LSEASLLPRPRFLWERRKPRSSRTRDAGSAIAAYAAPTEGRSANEDLRAKRLVPVMSERFGKHPLLERYELSVP